MGDPSHVPAGIYGEQALHRAGWRPKIIPTENVRAALRLVARGEAPLGLVYQSDAMHGEVIPLYIFPQDSHSPILYPAAITQIAGPSAQNFFQFLQSEEARMVYENFHFEANP